jgi:hypothetical protein
MRWSFTKLASFFDFIFKRFTLTSWVIIITAITITYINFNNHLWRVRHKVVASDVIGYYAYLPAAFIYKDLSFSFIDDDPEYFKDKMFNSKTPDGRRFQKMTMGLAFLYLPFFLLGHISAHMLGFETTGYSEPYYFFLVFSSLAWLMVGLYYLRKTLKLYFKEWISAVVMILIVFATNLLYYATIEAAMTHAYNFTLFAAFLWYTIQWHLKPELKNSLFIGLIFGMIVLIRPVNGLVVLFFAFYNVYNITSFRDKLILYAKHPILILIISITAFTVTIPQLVFWKVNTGDWLFYSYGDEGFFFNNPQIIQGWFSYRKGWLLYTPLMILALAGLITMRKRLVALRTPMLVFFPVFVYVIFSWWCWWYGGSFGSRPMIDIYAMLSLPIASLITFADHRSRLLRNALLVGLFLLMLLNLFQTYQYKKGMIHFDSMSRDAYWFNFGRLYTDSYYFELLDPVDYDSLLVGVHHPVPVIKNMIRKEAVCSFEQLNKTKKQFMSTDRHYKLNGGHLQTNEKQRSGEFSLKMPKEERFSAGIDFTVRQKERYQVSVWRYPSHANLALVMASENHKNFYQSEHRITETDENGWARIELQVQLHDTIRNKEFKVYVWNRDTIDVYVDDLIINNLGVIE